MSDPGEAAKQARKRAEAARARAEAALRRSEELKRRSRVRPGGPERAEEAARAAAVSDKRAADSARTAHKQAADVQEQGAEELIRLGDYDAARKARKHADEAREREDHTG